MTGYKGSDGATYLLGGLEDVTPEDVGSGVTGDVRKYLEILGVMRHVEDSVDGVTHDEELVLVQMGLFLCGERRDQTVKVGTRKTLKREEDRTTRKGVQVKRRRFKSVQR